MSSKKSNNNMRKLEPPPIYKKEIPQNYFKILSDN
jgi:hypothetical protein